AVVRARKVNYVDALVTVAYTPDVDFYRFPPPVSNHHAAEERCRGWIESRDWTRFAQVSQIKLALQTREGPINFPLGIMRFARTQAAIGRQPRAEASQRRPPGQEPGPWACPRIPTSP